MPTTVYLIYAAISAFIVAAICFCLVLIVRRFAALVCARGNAFPEDFGGFHETIAAHKTEIDEGYALYDSLIKEDVTIRAFDGLSLHGVFVPNGGSKKVLLLVHGYRSSARENFAAVLPFYIERGFALLMIDQRAHGKSGGRGLSFGILERRDAKAWAEYACERFGPEVPLILTGISMGASTVLMASDLDLPQSVCGVIADCGYTSPEQIIMKVAKEKGYPVKLLMPFARLAARLIGGFDLKEASAPSSLSRTKLPVLFIHGEEDRFILPKNSEAPLKRPCSPSPGRDTACRFWRIPKGTKSTCGASAPAAPKTISKASLRWRAEGIRSRRTG